jgi:hypothetical protein
MRRPTVNGSAAKSIRTRHYYAFVKIFTAASNSTREE